MDERHSKPAVIAALALAAFIAPRAAAADEPDPWRSHHGLTFEAGVGFGSVRGSTTLIGVRKSLAGPDLGVGWFINRHLAIGVRVVSYAHRARTGDYLADEVGAAVVQYWPAPMVWLGGGAGLGVAYDAGTTTTGLAVDARAGLSFNTSSRHTINIHVEVTPTFTSASTYVGVAICAGYQFL